MGKKNTIDRFLFNVFNSKCFDCFRSIFGLLDILDIRLADRPRPDGAYLLIWRLWYYWLQSRTWKRKLEQLKYFIFKIIVVWEANNNFEWWMDSTFSYGSQRELQKGLIRVQCNSCEKSHLYHQVFATDHEIFKFFKGKFLTEVICTLPISNGYGSEWSPIPSVLIRVITRSETAKRESDFFFTSMTTDRIGRHEVHRCYLLPVTKASAVLDIQCLF